MFAGRCRPSASRGLRDEKSKAPDWNGIDSMGMRICARACTRLDESWFSDTRRPADRGRPPEQAAGDEGGEQDEDEEKGVRLSQGLTAGTLTSNDDLSGNDVERQPVKCT